MGISSHRPAFGVITYRRQIIQSFRVAVGQNEGYISSLISETLQTLRGFRLEKAQKHTSIETWILRLSYCKLKNRYKSAK